MSLQLFGCLPLAWSKKPNELLGVMHFHETHRFRKVTIVRYDHSTVECVQPGVIEQLDGQVDVRALLSGQGRGADFGDGSGGVHESAGRLAR